MIVAQHNERPKVRYLDNPGFMSVEEAAERKGVSKRAVYKRIAEGRLPVMVVGKLQLVREKDVIAWEVDTARKEWGAQGGRPPGKKGN